jgi:hypothetical protein
VNHAQFDYIVHGLRIGYEEFQSVRPRTTQAPVPSETYYSRHRETHPELRRFTAAARFAAMDRVGGRAAGAGSESERALRESIGEYDPDVDDPNREDRPAAMDAETARPQDEPSGSAATESGVAKSDDSGLLETDVSVVEVMRVREPTREKTVPVAPSRSPQFPASGTVEMGDLLALDPERPGMLVRATTAQDPRIVGIAAGAPVEVEGQLRVTLVETFYSVVKADAGYGEIRPGDLLTSSFTTGHAMVALEIVPGTIIGKALEPLETGTGLIKVLVMPR